jgi:hypothetical protein
LISAPKGQVGCDLEQGATLTAQGFSTTCQGRTARDWGARATVRCRPSHALVAHWIDLRGLYEIWRSVIQAASPFPVASDDRCPTALLAIANRCLVSRGWNQDPSSSSGTKQLLLLSLEKVKTSDLLHRSSATNSTRSSRRLGLLPWTRSPLLLYL